MEDPFLYLKHRGKYHCLELGINLKVIFQNLKMLF